MPDLPPDQQTIDEMAADLTQRLHLYSPGTRAKGAALIAAGVTMLGTALGEEGLDIAATCSRAAILTTAEQIGCDVTRQ